MILPEVNTVMKFVDGLDSFVKFRIFSQDELQVLLKDAAITDRRSYIDLVLEYCVARIPDAARRKMEVGSDKFEHIREVLYDVCVGLNPALDIHKVVLPVGE